MSQVPFSNALKSKINSTTSTNPLQKIGGAISGYWNNIGPGRYHNPQSPDYTQQPGTQTQSKPKVTLPSVNSANSSFMSNNPQYSTPSSQSSSQTSGQITGQVTPPTPPVNTQTTPTPPPTNQIQAPQNQSTGSPFIGAVNGLQGIASGQPDYSNPNANPNQRTVGQAQSGLLNIAQNQTPEVTKAQKDYNDFAQSSPYMLAAQHNPNVAADIASGRSALLGQTFGAVLGAKSQAVQNAMTGEGQQITAGNEAGQLGLTGQGQQITAGQNVGSLTKPEAGASFFGSPVSGGLVGGQNGGGYTGNQLVDTSLSNAFNIIKSGGSTTDAMNALVGGDVAKTAFIKQMQQFDPNWSPTSSNAIAQQNMTQGQSYQEQATQLDTGLKQLDLITPTVIDYLNKSGLNQQENPFFNKSIKDYVSQFHDPAGTKILSALNGDVKKYTAQILGATGEINPTRIGEINDTFDPSDLSPKQLQTFLTDLKTLGTNQLSVLQGQSKSSYGGNSGYLGSNANPNTSLAVPTPNSQSPLNTSDPVKQALVGNVMSMIGSVGNAVKGLAHAAPLAWEAL